MMDAEALRHCYETIAVHSKSFSMASRLFSRDVRDRAVVVYAWCRRADDAVDLAGAGQEKTALERLRAELDDIYNGRKLGDPALAAFQDTALACGIHRRYAEDLLEGMRMDVDSTRYRDMATLLRYCYCVAGTVGLMMCHVMGVADERATRNAVHMGMAMQITNICRDVLEDWQRGRLYVPDEVLEMYDCRDLAEHLTGPIPSFAVEPLARSTAFLLDEADRYYSSGDAGLGSLSWRCALAVRTARRVYSAIGSRVRHAGCDPMAGRAIVPRHEKVRLATGALAAAIAEWPSRAAASLTASPAVTSPRRVVSFPDDVLPLQEG